MVVLASAITTKTGKALLSRQFVELSRVRIEGLLAAFPKLMGSEKQHTFIETDNVRYLYQPLESLYILLVTNKNSNILEDLETLHLLAKIVPEYSLQLDEKEVVKNAFEIIFAFDEAIAMGYKERVNLQQIKHFTTMESHDEIRHNLEQKNKMLLAKREMEKQQQAIEKKRREDKKHGISNFDMRGGSSGMGSGSGGYGGGSGSMGSGLRNSEPMVETKRTESPKNEPRFSKGMQLGKGKKTGGYTQILKEENVPQDMIESPIMKGGSSDLPSSNEKVRVQISEKLVLSKQNDGDLQNFEVKGELILSVFDSNSTKIKVHVDQGDNNAFQFKTHPNMNKTAFSNENVLALKDQSKAYPVGTSSSILKWRFTSKDDKDIPLAINVWPSTSSGETTVPVEFEKNCAFDLIDVVIAIPLPGGNPVIGDYEHGSVEYDSRKGILFWKIPLIDDSSKSGSMEFTVPGGNSGAFFPIQIDFKSTGTFCAIQAVQVTNEENKPVEFASDVSLSVEQFEITN